MSRSEQISKLLKTLASATPDIEAAAVVDNDGLMIASALPADVEDDRVAAMSAALLGMSDRIVRELGRGHFELVMIRGTDGFTILTRCGSDAVLTVLAAKTAKLGLIFLDISRSAKEIARLIS
ncbi:MAG: roadblock/LC7 domain-containing protein [Myxococcales bacterium]|nr:roadblock/LC7 domain-containing protein [Myxococcales bacterium]MCB9568211.1 roadblock/LC7 domain-containing protein [Myxococcales bacterium]MCB9705433.1 roadblock/LC7 domain-containing protein [Myxococcales bacterium]